MRSGLHIVKERDQLIAADFLQKAVETHPTAVGFALAKNGIVLHGSFPGDELDLLDSVQKTQEKYKSDVVYFHFTKAGEGEFGFDSLQPFPILMKGGEILLAVMLEGEFLSFVKPGEETPEYHIVTDYLKSKITEIYKECGTLEKTCAKLESPSVRADLKPHLDPRGQILFIPARGKAFAYSNNNLGGDFAWGSASRTLGFEPIPKKAPEPVKVEEPVITATSKPLTLRERAARKKALDAAEESGKKAIQGKDQVKEAAPPPKPDPIPAKKEEEKKLKPETPFSKEKGVIWCSPPSGSSWSQVKAFWNRNCRMNRPKAAEELYKGFPASHLKASAPLFAFLSEQDKNSLAATDTAFRDAMTKATENKSKKASTDADIFPGVLTVDEKRNAVELRKQDVYWKQTPEQLLAFSGENLKYSEQVQVPFEDLLHASIKFGMRLSKRELILLWHETRTKLLDERATKDKKTETTPAAITIPAIPAKPLTLREKAAQRKAAA